MDLIFNPALTQKYAAQPKYARFMKWLKDNGAFIDQRVCYPAYFGHEKAGVIGVMTIEPIQPRKAIVAIPYELVISVDKIIEMPHLVHIIDQNTDTFSNQEDLGERIMTLYVLLELLKGEKSFYHPYFEVSCGDYLENWSSAELLALEHPMVAGSIRNAKQKAQLTMMAFLRIFRRYQDIFPQDISNNDFKKLFDRALSFVCTRAFGWTMPSISLIPFADSFNHGMTYLTHFLVSPLLQLSPELPENFNDYQSHKDRHNLALLNDKLKPTSIQLDKMRQQSRTRPQKFVAKHQQILKEIQVEPKTPLRKEKRPKAHLFILYQQYKADIHNMRQLKFLESSCSQDNDSDEDQTVSHESKLTKFKFYDRFERLEGADPKKEIKTYLQMLKDQEEEEDSEEGESPAKKPVPIFEQGPPKTQADKAKILSAFKTSTKQSEGSSTISSTSSSDEEDQNFKWLDTSTKRDTYFVMSTRRACRQNEELLNFYGRRPNRFLLENYGFCFQGNKYDSYPLRLTTQPNKHQKLIVRKMSTTQKTKEIRIKGVRVCLPLIDYCRCVTVLKTPAGPPIKRLRIMIPFDLKVEEKALKLARDLLKTVMNDFSTTIEDDEQLIGSGIHTSSSTMHYAILQRIIWKKILTQQIDMLANCQQYLKRWKGGKIPDLTREDMETVRPIRGYFATLERGGL